MLLRYHPDKFFQHFGSRLELKDTQQLKEQLNQLTEQAMKLRRDLRPLEEA